MVRGVWRPFFAKALVGEDLRHTLLDGTVADDIDNVTNLVLTKVGGQSDHALLLEIAREGCVAESAFGVHDSHFPAQNFQCHNPPHALSPMAHRCPSSFFLPQRRGVRLTIASALPETG